MKNSLLLVGDPGCGKTTVIRYIMKHYPERFDQALYYGPTSTTISNIRAKGTRYISEWNGSIDGLPYGTDRVFVILPAELTMSADMAHLPADAQALLDAFDAKVTD